MNHPLGFVSILSASRCYPSAATAAISPLLLLTQAGRRWKDRGQRAAAQTKPRPKRQGRGGSTSALLFSGLNSREDSIRITPLQLLQAPHQAWTHIYIHISAPTSGCHQTYRASLPHQEKRIFLRCIPSCGSSFYRRMLLAQQNACTPLCSETCDKSYSQYRDFPPNLCFFLKASSQSARN